MIFLETYDWNSQSIEAVLDGDLFYLVLNWNETGRNWTLGIRNASYRYIITGLSLVPNYPLTWQFRYYGMPAGELFVLSPRFRNGPIPRDAFTSNQYFLTYFTEAELQMFGVLDIWGRTRGIAV
jgi:hypothetical protein